MKKKWVCFYTYTNGFDYFYAKNEKEAKEKAINLIKKDMEILKANPEEPLEELIDELYPLTWRDYLNRFIAWIKREDYL